MKKSNLSKAVAVSVASLILSSGYLAACAPKKAEAPKDNLQAVQLQTFPRPSAGDQIRLNKNTVFMWHEDLSKDDVVKVQELSSRHKDLDEEMKAIKLQEEALNKKYGNQNGNLTETAKSAELELGKVTEDLRQLQGAKEKLTNAQAKLDDYNKKIVDLKAQPGDHEDELDDLGAKVDIWKEEVNKHTATLQQLAPQENQLLSQKAQLEKAGAASREEEGAYEKDKQELDTRMKQASVGLLQLRDELTKTVDWYQSIGNFLFKFNEDKSISLTIYQWDLNDGRGPRDFTTEREDGDPDSKPRSIRNVLYKEDGGVLTFDVINYKNKDHTEAEDTYSFRINRTQYEDAKKTGLSYFTGEFIRHSADAKDRRGVAQLTWDPEQ